jgi:hypothetical protein
MNAIGILVLCVVLVVVLFAPRRWAVIGIMGGVLFLTQGQSFQVFGFNMFAMRFVELAAFLRVMLRREFAFRNLTGIDKLLIFLFAYTMVVFLLRSEVGQANRIGESIDAYLCYFTFRGLMMGGMEDFRWFLRHFLLLLAPYTACVLIESFLHNNLFSSMGGVVYGDWFRGGRIRCQGSFRNAALLGAVFASFLPIYLGLGFSKIDRKQAIFGLGLCLVIIWASNSGGPASAAAFAVLGWAFWRVRTKMKLVRRAAAAGFIALAIVMKAPVWYIIARVSSITGGAGWHRAHLMDMAFKHLDLWWLCGMPIKDTADWFPYVLSITGGADITNEFLAFGINAGLGALLLFCAILIQAFRKIGQSIAIVRSRDGGGGGMEPLLWGLGVMLTIHCINWLDITYFDQSYVIWFFDLAVINNVTEMCIASLPKTEGEIPLAAALESV